MATMRHLCEDIECIYFGLPTSGNSCRCHKTSEQMLAAENERLREALHAIGYMDAFMSKECAIDMMNIARIALKGF